MRKKNISEKVVWMYFMPRSPVFLMVKVKVQRAALAKTTFGARNEKENISETAIIVFILLFLTLKAQSNATTEQYETHKRCKPCETFFVA